MKPEEINHSKTEQEILKAILCLRYELPAEIVNDVQKKFDDYREANTTLLNIYKNT